MKELVAELQRKRIDRYVSRGESYAVPQWLIDRYDTKDREDAGE